MPLSPITSFCSKKHALHKLLIMLLCVSKHVNNWFYVLTLEANEFLYSQFKLLKTNCLTLMIGKATAKRYKAKKTRNSVTFTSLAFTVNQHPSFINNNQEEHQLLHSSSAVAKQNSKASPSTIKQQQQQQRQ